jgi:hypothetical protein
MKRAKRNFYFTKTNDYLASSPERIGASYVTFKNKSIDR